MTLSAVSLASHFVAAWAESQLGADPQGPNRVYNCVPASFALVLQALGYGYIHPQALEDLVYGAGHVGGSDFGYFIKRLGELGRWPNLPRMTMTDTSASDTVAFIHDALAQGFPVACDFKDNANAQLVAQWEPSWHGTHASVAVAVDASTISIINVWNGALQTFPHSVFGQATVAPAGNVVVFERNLNQGDSVQLSEKYGWVILAFEMVGLQAVDYGAFLAPAGSGRTPQVMVTLDAWAKAFADDGHNVADVVAQIILNSRKSGSAKPWGAAGPKGDKGDTGPAGLAPSPSEIVQALADAIKR